MSTTPRHVVTMRCQVCHDRQDRFDTSTRCLLVRHARDGTKVICSGPLVTVGPSDVVLPADEREPRVVLQARPVTVYREPMGGRPTRFRRWAGC